MTTDGLITARLWLPQPNEPSAGPYFTHEKRVVLIRGIIDRLRSSPEIVRSGMATALPTTNDSGTVPFMVEGWTPDRRDFAAATRVSVTPGYFSALGVRLVTGRLLDDSDNERAQRVVVINETLRRAYFGSDDPVGRRIRFVGRRGQISNDQPWITVVGVVRDVAEDGLDAPVRPQMYDSLWQVSNLNLAIVARGRSAPPTPSSLLAAAQAVDPNLPL
jgi:hypothetical protein